MTALYETLTKAGFLAGYDEANGGFRHENDHQFTSADPKAQTAWNEGKEQGKEQGKKTQQDNHNDYL